MRDLRVITAVLCTLMLISGCKKKEAMEIDNDTQSVVDHALAEQEFLAIVSAIRHSALKTKSIGDSAAADPCDSLLLMGGDPSDFEPNPIYTYNASNIACALSGDDHKSRSGQIQVRITGKVKNPGARMIIRLINYQTSGTDYRCDSIVVTTGAAGNYQVALVNGLLSTADYTIKYDFSGAIHEYPGGKSPVNGAFMKVYGNATGVNRQGIAFSTATSSAGLTRYNSCAYVSEGSLDITTEGFQKRTVDFGDGACDADASFTVNENRVIFKLK